MGRPAAASILDEDPGASPDEASFDTPSRRLAGLGCAVRHRPGLGWLVTIPRPDKVDPVGRDVVLVVGARGRRVPAEVAAIVGPLTRGEPLRRSVDAELPTEGEHAEVVRRQSARRVIADAVAAATRHLVLHLPAARLGVDPEGVHQARVASRRLRAELRTFRTLLDPDRTVELRRELGWLADVLGAVRDADVLEAHLVAAVDDLGRDHPIDPAVAARILEHLRRQRGEAHGALVAAIDGERVAELLAALDVASVDPPTVDRALGRAERRITPLVERPWRKLTRAVDRLAPEPTASDLHAVRLLTKRVRYAAEAAIPVFGRRADRFAKWLARVQDALGELNDAEVATAWLARAAHELDPDAAYLAGRLGQHLLDDAHHHRTAWRPLLQRCERSWATRP